jgi:hypothetical protein
MTELRDEQATNLESFGLKYIKNQKRYLIISIIYPVLTIIVQIFNLIFVRTQERSPPPLLPGQIQAPPPPSPIDFLTPIIILIIFSLFAIFQGLFLIQWNRKIVEKENKQQQTNDSLSIDNNEDENFTNSQEINQDQKNSLAQSNASSYGLSHLFYDIVNYMDNARIMFILMNIVFIIYLQWFIGYFVANLGIIPPLYPTELFIMHYVNLLTQCCLILYLGFQWKHFLRWNHKLQRLRVYERQIYQELAWDE